MKFGASSYIWVSPFSNDTLGQLAHAKQLGFDIYEIGVENPAVIDVEVLKAESVRVGIEIGICGAFGHTRDIGSDDPAIRKEGEDYIRTLIDMAVKLGAPLVSGPMYAATGRARLATADEKKQQTSFVMEHMKRLADYAGVQNIRLALEPLNRFETDFMNTVEQGMEFIHQLNCDNVGFLLDTFHMNIEEKNIPAAIRMAGDRVFHFHGCANDRGTPGEDHLDWAGIVAALNDVHYDGAVVIESFTTKITEIAKAVSLWRPLAASSDDLARDGLAFLQDIFK